jgi:hypothetical protein
LLFSIFEPFIKVWDSPGVSAITSNIFSLASFVDYLKHFEAKYKSFKQFSDFSLMLQVKKYLI